MLTGMLGLPVRSAYAPENVEKEDRSGGVYVKTPLVLSYDKAALPAAFVVTLNAVRSAPPDSSSGTKLEPSHLRTCPFVGAVVVISTLLSSPIEEPVSISCVQPPVGVPPYE